MSKKVTKVTKVTEPDKTKAAGTQQQASTSTKPEDKAKPAVDQPQSPSQGSSGPPQDAGDKKEGPAQTDTTDSVKAGGATVVTKPPAQTDATVIADADLDDEEEAIIPVNVALDLPAGTENPPLHMLNKQAWATDQAIKDADPLSGLEGIIGKRNSQKLLRRLPEEQAKAERVRQQQNRKHHRVTR